MKEWTIQLRRYGAIFLVPAALALVLGVLKLIDKGQVTWAIYNVYLMLAWVGLAGYACYELFVFFYLGRNTLLQLSPRRRSFTLVQLSAVFTLYLLPLFGVSLAVGMIGAGHNAYRSLIAVVAYYAVSKLVGLVAFFALICALIILVKHVRWTVLAVLTVFGGWVAMTVAHGYLLTHFLNLGAHHEELSIGFIWGVTVINQYLNALPVIIYGPHTTHLEDTMLPLSLALNGGLLALSLAIGWLILRVSRFNFVPR